MQLGKKDFAVKYAYDVYCNISTDFLTPSVTGLISPMVENFATNLRM